MVAPSKDDDDNSNLDQCSKVASQLVDRSSPPTKQYIGLCILLCFDPFQDVGCFTLATVGNDVAGPKLSKIIFATHVM